MSPQLLSSSTHHYDHPYKFMLPISDHIIRILCLYCVWSTSQLLIIDNYFIPHHFAISSSPCCHYYYCYHLFPTSTCDPKWLTPAFPARKNRHLHIGTRAISLTPFTYSVLRQQAVPPPINIYLASAAAAPFSIASCDLIRAMSDPTTWDFSMASLPCYGLSEVTPHLS